MNPTSYIDSIIHTLKHTFCLCGRARRREFWFYVVSVNIALLLLMIIGLGLGRIAEVLGAIWMGLTALVAIALAIPMISLVVRRLHDVNLSGFWYWYLTPCGLPVIYMVYLLDLDQSVNSIVEKIKNVGSTWLGWILAFLCWTVGAPVTLVLLFLYKGTAGQNQYGPDPLAEGECCCASCQTEDAPPAA